MLRASFLRSALAVAIVVSMATPSIAQDQPTVFVHGFQSSGAEWQTTADRLQQELAITAYAPTLESRSRLQTQADELQAGLSARQGTHLAVGHSNGGLVSRQLSRNYPLQGIVTLGTPNRGAPFARNVIPWAYWAASVSNIIRNILFMFGPNGPPPGVVVGIGIADRYGSASIGQLLVTLGIDTIFPVFYDMPPTSSFILDLNSTDNLAREVSQVPTRVGIVSFDQRYKIGGPFRVAAPDLADDIGLTMQVAGYVLDGAAVTILANANSSDAEEFSRALNQMYAVSALAGWLLGFDDEWCSAISNSTYPYGYRCDRSDGLVPDWAQVLPNAPNISFPGGPIHTEEKSDSHDQLYEALTVYAHIPPRGSGGDTVPPALSLTAPVDGSTVSGTVAVSADADDNVGVSRVEFRIDGVSIGVATGRPYQASWDTTGAVDGTHTILARAFDAAGHTATASEEVTVINGNGGWAGATDTLPAGMALASLTSPDGRFHFSYQGDGNVVLYRDDLTSIWASATNGTGVGSAFMQLDGNFVIYDASGAPVFATNTAGHPGAVLKVQNDGNVVIHTSEGVTLWTTGTGGK